MGLLEVLIPFLIWAFFVNRATNKLFHLYKRKKNPDFPIVHEDVYNYFDSPSRFLKIYLSPIVMWQIILERHKDKELNDAAKKVRHLLLLGLGIWVVLMVCIIYSWGWFTD